MTLQNSPASVGPVIVRAQSPHAASGALSREAGRLELTPLLLDLDNPPELPLGLLVGLALNDRSLVAHVQNQRTRFGFKPSVLAFPFPQPPLIVDFSADVLLGNKKAAAA